MPGLDVALATALAHPGSLTTVIYPHAGRTLMEHRAKGLDSNLLNRVRKIRLRKIIAYKPNNRKVGVSTQQFINDWREIISIPAPIEVTTDDLPMVQRKDPQAAPKGFHPEPPQHLCQQPNHEQRRREVHGSDRSS